MRDYGLYSHEVHTLSVSPLTARELLLWNELIF